jgi:hypothetical protein
LNGDEIPPPRKTRYPEEGIQAIAPFEHGDLLTTDAINELVEAIKELDRRLRELE